MPDVSTRKAYEVKLIGRVERSFLVWANSAREATEIMRSDRCGALAMDDHFTERGLTRPRRMPTEDRSDA